MKNYVSMKKIKNFLRNFSILDDPKKYNRYKDYLDHQKEKTLDPNWCYRTSR